MLDQAGENRKPGGLEVVGVVGQRPGFVNVEPDDRPIIDAAEFPCDVYGRRTRGRCAKSSPRSRPALVTVQLDQPGPPATVSLLGLDSRNGAPPCSVVCCHGRKCRMPGCVAPVLFPGHFPSGAMGARTPSRRIGRACGGGDVVTRRPRMRSVPVQPYRGAARRGEAAARRPGRSREAVRPRPGVGSRAECPAVPAAAREPDPARRPLPRQGAGHRAGVPALRQPRASRAVGPQERVLCADHDGRGLRHRGRGSFYD
jgi:hypothetical protein